MTSSHSFQPNWASPPGATLLDILEERNISRSEFARCLGYTTSFVNSLISGYVPINAQVAKKLASCLDTPEAFWINREIQYCEDATRIFESSFSTKDQSWMKELPISEMAKYGWLEPNLKTAADIFRASLRFFGVPSVEAWNERYSEAIDTTFFRTSISFDSHPYAVAAWLRKGEIESDLIKCSPWNPEKFETSLSIIRSLTRIKEPSKFLPKLVDICAACGVAVTIVKAPASCKASGATRFITPNKANILLSFRHLSDDHFWFSFFHEAGHLLLHRRDKIYLDGIDYEGNKEEDEANEFSANILIPKGNKEFHQLRAFSREIIRFAMKIGVSPGIVVGQLQHMGRLPQNRLNSLKRRYRWTR